MIYGLCSVFQILFYGQWKFRQPMLPVYYLSVTELLPLFEGWLYLTGDYGGFPP